MNEDSEHHCKLLSFIWRTAEYAASESGSNYDRRHECLQQIHIKLEIKLETVLRLSPKLTVSGKTSIGM